jgi:hypothetical protein
MLIVEEPVYSVENVIWNVTNNSIVAKINDKTTVNFYINSNKQLSSQYRAKRPVRQQKQVYDPKIEETVYVYEDEEGNEVYGIEHSEFNTPKSVVNLLVNHSNFSNIQGWLGGGEGGAAISF